MAAVTSRVPDGMSSKDSRNAEKPAANGTGQTWDSLSSGIPADRRKFCLLASTYKKQLCQPWDDSLIEALGLVTEDGMLTNAGLLFADYCPLTQCRSVCCRWDGPEDGYAINENEYSGNILLVLKMTADFIRANTATRWYKLPTHRLNIPEYSDRAILECTANHLVHRDYQANGTGLQVDIFDDRICFRTPGGMYDGKGPVQNRDISAVAPVRRNPVIAGVFQKLDLMEKNGLRSMQSFSAELPSYSGPATPVFQSDSVSFTTTFRNVSYGKTEEDFQRIIDRETRCGMTDCWDKTARSPENYPETGKTTQKTAREAQKTTQKAGKTTQKTGKTTQKTAREAQETAQKTVKTTQKTGVRHIGKTAQLIIDMIIADPTTTRNQFAEAAKVTPDAIKWQLKKLTSLGIISRTGGDRGGFWKVSADPPSNQDLK